MRRRVSVSVDLAACADDLAALRDLAAGGRAGLDEAIARLDKIIACLSAVVAKGAEAKPHGDRLSVRVHMIPYHEPAVYRVDTSCGRAGELDRLRTEDEMRGDVHEVTTPICNTIEVTCDTDRVTCKRCLRSLGRSA